MNDNEKLDKILNRLDDQSEKIDCLVDNQEDLIKWYNETESVTRFFSEVQSIWRNGLIYVTGVGFWAVIAIGGIITLVGWDRIIKLIKRGFM